MAKSCRQQAFIDAPLGVLWQRSVLTEGQGGTFIEMEAGNDPSALNVRLQVAMAGERLFRRWVEHALEKLRTAAESAGAASPR